MGPAHFLFWWNLIFSSVWIFLFGFLLFGVVGIFLKIPLLGIVLQGFQNKIKESGWFIFLTRHILVWLLSQGSILIGSYILAYIDLTPVLLPYFALGFVILGVYATKVLNQTNRSSFQFTVLRRENQEERVEKDITPR
ncbi:MAG: hypothetical protein O9301_04195 [Leptospira sp.]|nr:hypothetical protein [Leptospira sp.]